MRVGGVPPDWYRSSFSDNFDALYWEDDGEEKVDLVMSMLELSGRERILDLACATGRRSLELSRRGFAVIGVDIREELLSVAGCEAEMEDLYPYFVEADPREMSFRREFDLVLSLGGGAFGYFDRDEENLRAFAVAAQALRPGGHLLMQIPNVLHVEAHLPERTWISGEETVELVEQHWNAGTRRMDGTTVSMVRDGSDFLESLETSGPTPFQRRLYTVEELAEIFESVSLRLCDVFDENGERCVPTDVQQELFVLAHA